MEQFPELFVDKTILYVHGFGSSGQTGTVDRIRNAFPSARVVAPDLPLPPAEALDLLRGTCDREQPALVLGTSMGGMFAEMLTGFDRILVNPAFGIADTMQAHGLTGRQQFHNPRRDGVQEFYVDKTLLKAYRQITEENFAHADDDGEQQRVFGLFGDADPLVDTRELFMSNYGQAIRFHGEHRMNDHSFSHAVVPVMRWIDDRQERRQRQIVLIGMETTHDGWGGAASSFQKAVRLLIERYEVFFVAKSDTSRPAAYADTVAWLEEYVGVPAWNHTLFASDRRYLVGDFLIEREETRDVLATRLAFGSDTFKSWDDIITYFSRI